MHNGAEYFSDKGPALLANGYLIVPIKPGEKRPAGNAWEQSRWSQADVSRFPGHGVGVLTGQGACPIIGIDIDVSHPSIGPALIAWCHEQIGETFQRVGAAPRTLLVYQASEPGWKKRKSAIFFDPSEPAKLNGDKNRQAVEILGHGQQFVAYHVHPDAGRPYEWVDLFGGIEYGAARDLPVVTGEQVNALMREVERLIDITPGIEILSTAAAGTERDGDNLDRAETLARVTAGTIADVQSAVHTYAAWRSDDYDEWLYNLQAIKSVEQAGWPAEARAIAIEFSGRSAKYTAEGFETKWAKLNPETVTYRSIFSRAEADGWINPRKAKIDPERADGGRVDLTDSGNVNALFAESKGDLRYITERKSWMQWDGLGWRVDESGSAAKSAALRVAEMWRTKALEKEAEANNASGEDRKRLTKIAESYRSFAAQCRNRRGLDNMLALAARDDRFAISVSVLDCDRWALGVANGVVDLRNGELRPSSRDDFITKRSPYTFKTDAQAPRWCQFIEEITALPVDANSYAPRAALAAYLHRALGYAATGRVSEQKMFVGVGAGSNGKNVAFDVLAAVLGPYCVQLPPDAMMASSRDADGERPTPFARNLAGARLAFGSEAKEGQKLNAAWVKKQTGDAKLTARGLHESPFTFDVTHKLFLLTNHQPHLDHMDEATRGRLHLVPFDRRWNRPGLPSRDPSLPDGDKHLMDKLITEAEGILAWIVRGAVAYARDGLEPPAEVVAKTLDYFEQQDALAQWLTTMERCPTNTGTGASALFAWFASWCADEGFKGAHPSTPHAFGKALQALGIERARPSTGTVWGLRSACEVSF